MVAPAFAKGSKTGRKTGNTSTSTSVALEVIVTYIQNNSHNIHTTGELLLQNALYYRLFEVQQQNSNPTPQVVET